MFQIRPSKIYSIEKTTELLHMLIDLRKKQSLELPEVIAKRVDNLLAAQQYLMWETEKYLSQSINYRDDTNIEMIIKIVQTCPDFLAAKSECGRIPCHAAASVASSSVHKHLLSFANVGCQHNIGGEGQRGGLLTPDTFQLNALHAIKDPKVFDMLKKHNPPLFYIEDVEKYNLLHNAIQFRSLNLIKYFCNLDPCCLHYVDDEKKLPIHHAVKRPKLMDGPKVVQYLLQQSVSQSVSNKTIGGLFTKMPDEDNLALEKLVMNHDREGAWDCIERALSANTHVDKLPILHQTIQHTPHYCTEVMNRFPSSIHVRDSNNKNRLPIYAALETGMKSSIELTCLIAASQKHLTEMDPVTKWPPFVLAAMGTSCDMVTIYRLLQKNPEHVEMWCDDSVRYKYIPVENCKRRKMNE